MQNQQSSEIEQLFEKARQNGRFEYLNTLDRIDGIQLHADYKDQLLVLRHWLDEKKLEDPLEFYRYLITVKDPMKLLQNLVNNSNGQHYHVSPFLPLAKGAYPN